MDTHTALISVIAFILGAVFGAAAIYAAQQGRRKRLKEKFGPEYDRTVAETGSRLEAEAVLEHRQRRVQQLHVRPLSPAERARFVEGWREIQARFVDDPSGALKEADRLVGEVMATEGYPMLDFEQRAADISVDHPVVTDNYREAHRVAVRDKEGNATTEELRKAMIHYRTLFDELAGHAELAQAERIRL
jgi:hypothetical protein